MSRTYKIILVGNAATGKTSILNQYIHNDFVDKVLATIGIEFQHKSLDRDTKLTFWDTAGQERFRNSMKSFFRGADAVMFVYDISNRESFYALNEWWRQYNGYGNILQSVAMLVGNKSDLETRQVSAEEARAWAMYNNISYEEVSAKTADNIHNAFEILIGKLKKLPEVQRETVRLQNEPKTDRCCY